MKHDFRVLAPTLIYQTPPNMSSFGAVCESFRKTFLSLLVDNLGASGGLCLNSSPVNVKLIIFPLFLPKGNAILPITPKAVCESYTAEWNKARAKQSVLSNSR